MFVHLNKKISIPNCTKVRSIAWSKEHDFIACGGDNGLLKVIKLDSSNNPNSNKSSKGEFSKNLSLNQTLEGHKSAIQSICWNESFQKLTSSDANGTIIVWMLYKGMWYEEMVNNRNKSLVSGMAWTHDGQKICIVYDDGAIITGSVDGNRIWGKELKNSNLIKVEWSPDGKIILIGNSGLEIQIFDHLGNLIRKLPLTTLQSLYNRSNNLSQLPRLVGIRWFKNYKHERPLIVAFDDGRIQLMKHENDETPLLINTELKITSVKWNYIGDMFAVTGSLESNEGANKNYLKLYSNHGHMLQMIKVSGNEIFDCSWDKTGLKIALAVDSYIFFASVKPRYDWAYLTNSIVFVSNNLNKFNATLNFCELNNSKFYEKNVQNFCQMTSWNFCCGVVTKVDNAVVTNDSRKSNLYALTLYNSVGTLIDHHLVNLTVTNCCMNSSKMIVTSDDSFYVWNFNHLHNYSSTAKNFYPDNKLYAQLLLKNDTEEIMKQQSPILIAHNDPVLCITASDKFFVVGHESGILNQFLFPNATHVHKISINCIPYRLSLNKNSSKLSFIDKSAKFYIYDFDAINEETSSEGNWLDLKCNDTWDMKWASDNNDLIAILEKNKLTIINASKLEKEDPIISNGYICMFENLVVKTVRLDSLISDTIYDQVSIIDAYIETNESQYIRDLKDIMNNSLTDAVNYCLQLPNYPSLWNIIIDESLQSFNFGTAVLAMVKCKDYKGLQFVKKLNKLQDDVIKKAEINAYLGRYKDAESAYLEIDRPDLAVYLNKLLGDYLRVLELLEKYTIPNHEKEMENAYMKLAQYHADNYEWINAAKYFELIDAPEQLVDCYINLENYNGLVGLIERVTNKNSLIHIGQYLESMGLCKESAMAYVKANTPEMAINACVRMSEWKLAIDLANEHHIQHVDSLLEKYVQHMIADKKFIEIIEVYKKANKVTECSSIVMKLINELKKANKDDAITFKKLYVLIGIIHEESKERYKESKTNTLDELLSSEEMISQSQNNKMIEDPWKGAEAYHFLLLTHRHLYQRYFDLAMKTALHLEDYEEYIPTEKIYSLIALTSYSNKCFEVCSRAFIKLEAINLDQNWNAWTLISDYDDTTSVQSSVPEERRIKYEQLAVTIFSENSPNQAYSGSKVECKFCSETIPDYSTSCPKCHNKFLPCISSGISIMDLKHQWLCKQCGHYSIKTEISSYNNCPLCHYKID